MIANCVVAGWELGCAHCRDLMLEAPWELQEEARRRWFLLHDVLLGAQSAHRLPEEVSRD
jgi:hypothetical protein